MTNDAAEGAKAAEESAITGMRILVGDDGLGYYVATYDNGERGPRSEGYGRAGQDPVDAMDLAARYAERDFPWLDPKGFVYELDDGD